LAFAGIPDDPLVPVEYAPLVLEKVRVGVAGLVSKSWMAIVVCPHPIWLRTKRKINKNVCRFSFKTQIIE
jgi:hypothetical protein